jgi:putative ABC transport system permease protein
VRQGMTLVLVGIAAGVLAAVGLTRLLTHMLYGVRATDPATFVGVALLLAGEALMACTLPAARAAKVDALWRSATSDTDACSHGRAMT